MGMGRGGLVAYVEAQIERDIALGRLHPSGQFGSEAKLARRYEVCRGTIREALRRLAARGLVVQRPGRRTRAVALDVSLTLENLGLALHDASNPDARWLLEGYFSLKRQVLLELLADCCARASHLDLDRLGSTCFQLQDAARWEPGATCAQVEFELLRQAARVAERPGHVLLVQSLQRAFLGGAAQLLPLMGGEALREWAFRVMAILHERDVQALQHELPALLKACDERVLNAFAPAPQEQASPEAPLSQKACRGVPVSPPAQDTALGARPGVNEPDLGDRAPFTVQETAFEVRPHMEEPCLVRLAPAAGDSGAHGIESHSQEAVLSMETAIGALFPTAPSLNPGEPGGVWTEGEVPGSALSDSSDRRSGWGASSPEGGLQAESLPDDSRGDGRVAESGEDGLIHGALSRLGRWAVRLWCSMTRLL
ncbi:GntR family transcriptional regulator [Corallococcus coralloides DSM 2259]|uniref:GntR family transcriptional regulator n=1 Tax=Corallococcus coralloides (strain ATCC 25202 / DSM 2259 / NBRC 100086 / M2) TaxID=1144275 RepID=H8MNG7_CORCM|nr:GntR family transcriptional regulator [Corallococcus coralloides]AFE06083.1 GntR family transcriptional regulator [Corallococcus coralloides DSM 2259]